MQIPEIKSFEPFELNRAGIFADLLERRHQGITEDWQKILLRESICSLSKDLLFQGRGVLYEVLCMNTKLRRLVMSNPNILNTPEYLNTLGFRDNITNPRN